MGTLVVLIIIGAAIAIVVGLYKAGKVKGTSSGPGGILPGEEPGKHTNDENQTN